MISPGSEPICLPRPSPGTDLVHPCPSPGSGNRGCWSQTSLSSDLTRIDLGLPDPCKGVASRPLSAHPSAGVQDFCKAGFIWLLSSAQGLCPHPPLTGVSPSALHPLRRLGGPLLDPCPAPSPHLGSHHRPIHPLVLLSVLFALLCEPHMIPLKGLHHPHVQSQPDNVCEIPEP